MSFELEKLKLEDDDKNCRLRHGLNVDCLAHIFQYLDSADLYRLGGMNEYYKQIINEQVIQDHKVHFGQLYRQQITVQQMFERYGTRIRWFIFHPQNGLTINQFIQMIIRYCSYDQLRGVEISFSNNDENIHFPIHFQNVKYLNFNGGHNDRIFAQFSNSLHYLKLTSLTLNRCFNWTRLKNLTTLNLNRVNGINAQNFIEFLRQQPNLKRFHHCRRTFGSATHDVCDAVAEYCGNQIEDYSGKVPNDRKNLYTFVSKFTNVKTVHLWTNKNCGGNLIEALKLLAENDTVETLNIWCLSTFDAVEDCRLREEPNIDNNYMGEFTHLKTFGMYGGGWQSLSHHHSCPRLKFLKLFASQIISNVEYLKISFDNDLIRAAPKLRFLDLNPEYLFGFTDAFQLIHALDSILRRRMNNNTTNDFIEINMTSYHDRIMLFNKLECCSVIISSESPHRIKVELDL